jgi:uncharacterized membrane protein YccC
MELPRAFPGIREGLRSLHWTRGLRAGVAVAAAMIVCHALGQPTGWAALGGFEAILVDNGGPYRSRFATIATLMLAGTVACVAASLAVGRGPVTAVLVPTLVTAVFCFVVTFARVAAQPVASTSVIILVIYFAALGGSAHTLRQALGNALAFVLGGAWAAALSLLLWPVDPFRPARQAVARCYDLLAGFTSGIEPTGRGSEARETARRRGFEWQRQMRRELESARTALGTTAARVPSRTIRARNLTVLLETADMLLLATMRLTELALGLEVGGIRADSESTPPPEENLSAFLRWLSDSERAIARGLRQKSAPDLPRPYAQDLADAGRAQIGVLLASPSKDTRSAVPAHLEAVELDASQNIEIACEAVNAVWSGTENRAASTRLMKALQAADGAARVPRPAWTDAVRANWTFDSVMMRHALRMTVVGAADVLLLHAFRLSHGFWLAMTSIIVLQPYQSHTLKRGIERVGGTIAGGILAAILAVAVSSQAGIIAVITVTATLTLATYAVDYAWYCFFLTPTFVLMSLPHLRDWQYSGVRILTTLLGAAVAVAAMRLLWPEREHLALGRLLSRAAAADAAYIRAILRYWNSLHLARSTQGLPLHQAMEERRLLERQILAPARRACGLASNDAEESLDRLMQETGFGRFAAPAAASIASTRVREHALTYVTYVRRLTQSASTVAVLGDADSPTVVRLESLAERLESLSQALLDRDARLPQREARAIADRIEEDSGVLTHQLQRMERQVAILERAAAGVLGGEELAPSIGEVELVR